MPSPPLFVFPPASPSLLMDELEKFLVFWVGPWRPEYGESEIALRGQRLPDPLRRVYAFAGRWACQDDRGRARRVFNSGEGLRPLEYLERTWIGSLVFADECQANWSCRTRSTGADPAVWVKDNCGMDFYRWRRVDRSLSRFLVTLGLRELIGNSRFMKFDKNLEHWFRASMAEAIPLWSKGAFPYCPEGYSYYLLAGSVLVGDFGSDGVAFAANSDEGIQLLKSHQG